MELYASITMLFETVAFDVHFCKDRRLVLWRRIKDDNNCPLPWAGRYISLGFQGSWHQTQGYTPFGHADMNRICSPIKRRGSLQTTVQITSWTERSLHVLVCRFNYLCIPSKWCVTTFLTCTNTSRFLAPSQLPLATDTIERPPRTPK